MFYDVEALMEAQAKQSNQVSFSLAYSRVLFVDVECRNACLDYFTAGKRHRNLNLMPW